MNNPFKGDATTVKWEQVKPSSEARDTTNKFLTKAWLFYVHKL